MSLGPTTVAAVLAVSAALGAPASARAQGPMAGHGVPAAPRSLHVRLAAADAVAIGTIDAVELGRFQVREAVALAGDVPAEFQIKRSPSRSPAIEPKRAALLLLRGARSPYLLLDDSRELVSFDPSERTVWEEAVRRLLACGSDARAQLGVYVDWLATPDAALRGLARVALADRGAAFQPLPADVARGRARAAFDGQLGSEERRSNAWIAALTPEGAAALLEAVPGDSAHADSSVVLVALQAGAMHHSPQGSAAFVRALASSDPSLRLAALRMAALYSRQPDARRALERAAAAETDPRLKGEFERALR
jgi:hypothetical protein